MAADEADELSASKSPLLTALSGDLTDGFSLGGDAPVFADVEDYVRKLGGTRPVRKVLIANNGIGAVKAIRSIRKWAYETFGREKEVQLVAMATPEDLRSNAEYIRMADDYVDVPGGSNNNNYANVMLILELAERFKVQAVWAGWGHASENPALPRALAKLEPPVAFIGPGAAPMHALGDKIGSSIIAQSASVPTMSWSGDGLTTDYASEGLPEDLLARASVTTAEEAATQAERIGYPVMIKASEGGGGKGIRKVEDASGVRDAFRQVRGEVPGSPIFIMRLAFNARHLEVQLLADEYGTAIALAGRDCSVQRRHQKIMEEGPVLAAPPEVWREMERAAVRLAVEVGYSNAGTVEYLYTPDNKFYFLELNPRLQVEHPVTEMIKHVNLPAAQLQVAMGIPMHRIPDVRRLYGHSPFGDSAIDFETEEQRPPAGHVIAARITAENPDLGFQPTSGAIKELNFRSTPDVWGYFSVDSSGRVHEFADSQIGHLFSWGTTREQARRNMVLALKELSIRGDIRTTVEYLVLLMEHEDYLGNSFDTGWLDERIRERTLRTVIHDEETLKIIVIGAAVNGSVEMAARQREWLSFLERGQIPPPGLLDSKADVSLIYEGTKYDMQLQHAAETDYRVLCNGTSVLTGLRALADGGYLVQLGGQSYTAYAHQEPTGLRLVVDGNTYVFTNEYDPTRIRTDVPGKLVRYLVEDGAEVKAGTSIAEIEVMKMFMPLVCPEAGTIQLLKPEGSVLDGGSVVASLVLDDPSKVKRAEPFTGQLPDMGVPRLDGDKPHFALRRAQAALATALDGYIVPLDECRAALQTILATTEDALLPLLLFREALSVLAGRVPPRLEAALHDFASSYDPTAADSVTLAAIPALVQEALDELPESEHAALQTRVAELMQLNARFSKGLPGYRRQVIADLAAQFLAVELAFPIDASEEDVLMELRAAHKDSLATVFRIAQAHAAVAARNQVVDLLLRHIASLPTDDGLPYGLHSFMPMLRQLATLSHKEVAAITLEARQLLIKAQTPSPEQRLERTAAQLADAVASGPAGHREVGAAPLIDEGSPMFDTLVRFFRHPDADLASAAMEAYLRRVYRTYALHFSAIDFPALVDGDAEFLAARWTYEVSAPTAVSVGMLGGRTGSFDDLAGLLSTPRGSETPALGWAGTAATAAAAAGSAAVGAAVGAAIGGGSGSREARRRRGAMAHFRTLAELDSSFGDLLALLEAEAEEADALDTVLHVALTDSPLLESELAEALAELNARHRRQLELAHVHRVTFVLPTPSRMLDPLGFPRVFTFRRRLHFQEDMLLRHMEPTQAHRLELSRLRNFNIRALPTHGAAVHLYEGMPRDGPRGAGKRLFVRSTVRNTERILALDSEFDVYPGPERKFVECLKALELAMGKRKDVQAAHVFLNILPVATVNPDYVGAVIRILASRYRDQLRSLRVAKVEFKLRVKFDEDAPVIPVRLVSSNPTGYVLRTEQYVEVMDDATGVTTFTSIGDVPGEPQGELEGLPTSSPYLVTEKFELKRQAAQAVSQTLYVYDWPTVLARALRMEWKAFERASGRPRPEGPLLTATELVLVRCDGAASGDGAEESKGDEPAAPAGSLGVAADGYALAESDREPGNNDIGMVAWKMHLVTPEYPDEGREMIVICNDITHKVGSFGTQEDLLFNLASRYSRAHGLPRIYLSANSGARIGLAEEVRRAYRAAWIDSAEPSKGFHYLYLTEEDHARLTDSVLCERVEADDGEVRYRIDSIIGEQHGLGVENLRGSGEIAGETSRAYDEVFTLTYVTGRSVGIGAYLVRLGQRTIQKRSQPILLTGYGALNRLMGKDVYTSNLQLGGPKIMFENGVSHQTVGNDLEGCRSMLRWLSYVPCRRHAELPVLLGGGADSLERDIDYEPTAAPADPRNMLTGVTLIDEDGCETWQSGFFDRGSWTECMAGWAKTVITGRARLGGIPVGFITPEVRTVIQITPADPATPQSQEQVTQQAGQVWFPDSAFKTATALRDFRCEDLPVFIFANWRGFSGGQRDMFHEVLKYGSVIVDALVDYTQPVFIYIPPFGELRGGAWVVVDPTINSEVMEMYAAESARGGVLEPSGTIAIKYRHKHLKATATRLDPKLRDLADELKDGTLSAEERKELQTAYDERLAALLPIYSQIATQFADAHDTPGRMLAKGCIRQIIPWRSARRYFSGRLRRKLKEFALQRYICNKLPDVTRERAGRMLYDWFIDSVGVRNAALWEDDSRALTWMVELRGRSLEVRVAKLRQKVIASQVAALGLEDPKALVTGVLDVVDRLDKRERDVMIMALRRSVIFLNKSSSVASAGAAGGSSSPAAAPPSSPAAKMEDVEEAEEKKPKRRLGLWW